MSDKAKDILAAVDKLPEPQKNLVLGIAIGLTAQASTPPPDQK